MERTSLWKGARGPLGFEGDRNHHAHHAAWELLDVALCRVYDTDIQMRNGLAYMNGLVKTHIADSKDIILHLDSAQKIASIHPQNNRMTPRL